MGGIAGAVGGAWAGVTLCAAAGPWGMLAGGVIGGILGLISGGFVGSILANLLLLLIDKLRKIKLSIQTSFGSSDIVFTL